MVSFIDLKNQPCDSQDAVFILRNPVSINTDITELSVCQKVQTDEQTDGSWYLSFKTKNYLVCICVHARCMCICVCVSRMPACVRVCMHACECVHVHMHVHQS